ncbi:hypothetical protein [Streptomyces sp. HUAS TT20]|uniref:hypothetical protein n=1 Tax=Streptomyces sp. HUAS TT20 TaxID=3447509 RepID=UPI0021D9360E|nr:hypothetical protein [Streptomyces sp. HUAS 15-9]UXY29176.1 hypothetical protein N8I87_23220 [Streptomyces sp. HUAS 15-9]
MAGTAAGEIFNGILDGFDGDGSQEKEQVYHNVRRMDQLQNSASLTTEQSVKAATGDDAAASRSGDRAGLGFSDADALIDNSNAEM